MVRFVSSGFHSGADFVPAAVDDEYVEYIDDSADVDDFGAGEYGVRSFGVEAD